MDSISDLPSWLNLGIGSIELKLNPLCYFKSFQLRINCKISILKDLFNSSQSSLHPPRRYLSQSPLPPLIIFIITCTICNYTLNTLCPDLKILCGYFLIPILQLIAQRILKFIATFVFLHLKLISTFLFLLGISKTPGYLFSNNCLFFLRYF